VDSIALEATSPAAIVVADVGIGPLSWTGGPGAGVGVGVGDTVGDAVVGNVNDGLVSQPAPMRTALRRMLNRFVMMTSTESKNHSQPNDLPR
jgi:hypothetical protein